MLYVVQHTNVNNLITLIMLDIHSTLKIHIWIYVSNVNYLTTIISIVNIRYLIFNI